MKQKKSISNKVEDKSKKKFILAIFIAFIMITSTAGFVIFYKTSDTTNDNNPNEIVYNGYKFYRVSNGWTSIINGRQMLFSYNPEELKDIEFNEFQYKGSKVYVAFNDSERTSLLDYNVNKLYGVLKSINQNSFLACIDEGSCKQDIPIVNCNIGNTVFYIKENTHNSNKESIDIKKDNDCILIEGGGLSLNRGTDKVIYYILGVINE